MAAVNGFLYICGSELDGLNETYGIGTAEKYCPKTDKWTTISPMNSSRASPTVIAFDECVYALGGYDGTSYSNLVSENYLIISGS